MWLVLLGVRSGRTSGGGTRWRDKRFDLPSCPTVISSQAGRPPVGGAVVCCVFLGIGCSFCVVV